MNKTNIPFRRKLKWILKNYQRNQSCVDKEGEKLGLLGTLKNYQRTELSVAKELKKLGLLGNVYELRLILKSKLKGSTIARLGRAALKRGAVLPLMHLWWAYINNVNQKTHKHPPMSYLPETCRVPYNKLHFYTKIESGTNIRNSSRFFNPDKYHFEFVGSTDSYKDLWSLYERNSV